MVDRTILRGFLALAVAVIACTGCDDAESAPFPAIHDLAEAWQATPFAVDPAIIAAAERSCRDPRMAMMPQVGISLVVADTRGGGALYLKFAAAGGDEAECFVERDANGTFTNQGGGSSSGGNAQPALPATGILLGGSGSQSGDGPGQTKSFASGRAGAAIAIVEVVLSDNRSLQASLNGGWFAAWWPTDKSVRIVRGYDSGGTLVGTSP